MKKILFTLVLAAILTATAACANTSQTPPTPEAESTVSSETASSEEQSADQDVEQTVVYGKVSAIVGNEIDLTTGTTEDVLPSLDQPSPEEDEEKPPMMAAMLIPAEDAATEFVAGDKVEPNEAIIEIAYGSEIKSVILPTGVTMIDLTGKGKSELTDVKEGSVLRVTMVGDTVVCVEFLS